MSFVANGLDVGPGDEVVTTDHEHIGGLEPWRLVTTRRGATLVVARCPSRRPRPRASSRPSGRGWAPPRGW